MNLLKETLASLKENKKTASDVQWVGIIYGEYPASFSWNEFSNIAKDFDYNNSYGGTEVTLALRIVGDNWWLERGEYDGSEWWEFKTQPIKPPYRAPLKRDIKED